jgi:hypothetical protein
MKKDISGHLQTKHAGCHFIPEAMIFQTALER